MSDTAGSMKTGGGKPGQGYPAVMVPLEEYNAIAFSCKGHGADASDDVAPTIRSMEFDESHMNGGGQVAVAFNLRGRDGGAMPETAEAASIRASQGGSSNSYVAFQSSQSDDDITTAFHSTGGTHGVGAEIDISPSIPSPPSVSNGMGVRRLTPLEVERCFHFSDGWTDIPFNGKPASDSQRYRALGNSIAVPVLRWIGERIKMVDEL